MKHTMDYPLLVFAISLLVLWLSTRIGAFFREKRKHLGEDVREDFSTILAATLTLLGLIIGFSFAMAIGRYDQRRITKRKRRMQSAQNMFGPICFPRLMPRK